LLESPPKQKKLGLQIAAMNLKTFKQEQAALRPPAGGSQNKPKQVLRCARSPGSLALPQDDNQEDR